MSIDARTNYKVNHYIIVCMNGGDIIKENMEKFCGRIVKGKKCGWILKH